MSKMLMISRWTFGVGIVVPVNFLLVPGYEYSLTYSKLIGNLDAKFTMISHVGAQWCHP